MSLTDVLNTLNTLNGKSDGDLITSLEWNNLVDSVIGIGQELQAVTGRVDAVEAYVGYVPGADPADNLTQRIVNLEDHVGNAGNNAADPTLTGRVMALEAEDNVTQDEFDGLKDDIDPLLAQYIVSFSTSQSSYLIGDTATITAQVRNLDGSIPGNRPWVDFIATWGTLKAASGFTDFEGTGKHCISVRTNAQGIARVRLTAEQHRNLTTADEDELNAFFKTALPSEPVTFNEAIFKSDATNGEFTGLAYAAATKEYESNHLALKRLADDYFMHVVVGAGDIEVRPHGTYRDYRSIVVGFAKNDANSTTPDPCRGTASIQILFRDWISSWQDVYVEDDDDWVWQWKGDLEKKFEVDEDKLYDEVMKLMDEATKNLGVLARHKSLQALGKAAREVDDSILPDRGCPMKDVVRYAAETQQAMDILQFAIGGTETKAGNPMMGAMLSQGGRTNEVSKRSSGTVEQVFATTEYVELKGAVEILQKSTTTVGKNLVNALGDIENKVVKINAFDSDSLQNSVNQIMAKIGVAKNIAGDV